jgi:hypothetical protein
LNAYTGEDNGRLDKANMGQYLSNLGLSQLEALVAQKRQQLGQPQFDYSGGRSMSQYADAVPATGQGLYGHGLYGGMPMSSAGRGLYGGDIGDDIYHGIRNTLGVGLYGGALHPRKHRHRREVGSVGIQGNLLGSVEPPALESQAYGANFQFGHTLPPAFQKFAKSGRGLM